MKQYVSYFMLIAIVSVFVSCASSKSTTTVLSGTDISKSRKMSFVSLFGNAPLCRFKYHRWSMVFTDALLSSIYHNAAYYVRVEGLI